MHCLSHECSGTLRQRQFLSHKGSENTRQRQCLEEHHIRRPGWDFPGGRWVTSRHGPTERPFGNVMNEGRAAASNGVTRRVSLLELDRLLFDELDGTS